MPAVKKYQTEQNAVFVDLGDSFYAPTQRAKGNQEKQDQQAALIKEMMARLKYDAFVPGELDIKPDFESLVALQKESGIPILAGNMVDPETGEAVFESSRIIERSGYRIALVGVVGPGAFNIVPANVDYDPRAAKPLKKPQHKFNKGLNNTKALTGALDKLKSKGDQSPATAAQIAKLTAIIEGQSEENEKAAEEPEAQVPAPPYEGRRFKITDPADFAMKELARLQGKADLFVLCGHMTKSESDELKAKAAGYHLFLDGHGQGGKSRYFKDEGPGPSRIRAGSRGQALTLVKLMIENGNFNFEDRSGVERDKRSLERQKKSRDRVAQQLEKAEGEGDQKKIERHQKRLEHLDQRIAELEERVKPSEAGSYFNIEKISLDAKIPADPEIEKKQTAIAGEKPAKNMPKPKMMTLKKKDK